MRLGALFRLNKVCSVHFQDRIFYVVGDYDEIVAKVQNDEPIEVFETMLDGSITTDWITFFQPVDYVRTQSGVDVPPALQVEL